jgi:hypothetical protein
MLNPDSAGPGAAATSATSLRPAGGRAGSSSPAIAPGVRGGRAQAALVSRAALFEAGNCSRHARAGYTLLARLAARSICSEAFPYRRGRYQVGRAKLVAGRRASWPHWPEPAWRRSRDSRPIPRGARHLAFAATTILGLRREGQRHAAFGSQSPHKKRCRRCALPPQSKSLSSVRGVA